MLGETNTERVIIIILAVLSWLLMGRAMRSGKRDAATILTVLSCLGAFLYIMYLVIVIRLHG